MYFLRYFFAVAIISLAGYSQAAGELPTFEAASVRQANADPSKGITVRANGGPGSKDPTRFTAQNFTLRNLITTAYKISHWQLSSPELDQNRETFDVAATMAEGTTREQFELMLQRLLAERFGVKVHWDEKEMPSYELVVTKNGPKFKPSQGEEEAPPDPNKPVAFPTPKLGSGGYPQLARGRSGTMMMNGKARVQRLHETMARWASMLSGQVSGPVQDATGLTGTYDLELYWSSGNSAMRAASPISDNGSIIAADVASGPTIFEALKDQLGLMLVKKNGPVKVLVVDHFDKLPTAN